MNTIGQGYFLNRFRMRAEVLSQEHSHPLKPNWAERQLRRRVETQQKNDANIFRVEEPPERTHRDSTSCPWFGLGCVRSVYRPL